MRQELVTKSKSLTGSSDLTLLAPLKPGFVGSLDSLTYKTRTKRLLKTLNGGRSSLHEYALYRPLSDSVERVAVIQSFRVMVVEPEDKVLLAVTFDGTWESYIRILWQKVGTLLDIIFCNTENYVNSQSAGFEAWADWVRSVQIETQFFYNTHGLTVHDVAYLRGEEAIQRLSRGPVARDLLATRNRVRTAELLAWDASHDGLNAQLETVRQGLQSLALLFRQTDAYLPGTADGDVLKRAACDLLVEFRALLPQLPPNVIEAMKVRFGRQLQWLGSGDEASDPPRPVPVLPETGPTDMYPDIQAGILRSFEGMTHGCLLMLAIDDCRAGAELLTALMETVTTEANRPGPGELVTTFSLSYEGLRALGLSEEQLALFPQEFREGMEARASILGDFRTNHPRRWRLPLSNWDQPDPSQRIQMSTIHLVVQMRIGSESQQHDPAKTDHPLHPAINRLLRPHADGQMRRGVRVLSVQSMRRHSREGKAIEHFGFVDGLSDPVFDKAAAGKVYPNQVQVGEFLWGRANAADVAPESGTPEQKARMELLRDGSFLAVRKLSQNVDVLHNLVKVASQETGLDPELILAKMMGRTRKGESLVDPETPNDFDYRQDPHGSLCPIHSHARRANPRFGAADSGGPPEPVGARQPRLMRRGMSYGPLYASPPANETALPDGQERGLIFMAYVSSLAEQFETVQRWLTGGNSAGGYSRQSDPFLGVPEVRGPDGKGEPCDERRGMRFEHNDEPYRIALDEAPKLDAEPQPVVRLEWGMYLFSPSIPAMRRLRDIAKGARQPAPAWSVREGALALQSLFEMEKVQGAASAKQAWKALLEDPDAQEKYRSASAWAAIRTCHGGALRTPYGLVVADRKLVMSVLGDKERFSVSGYNERMRKSLGEIYLGLDSGAAYKAQSARSNAAISAIEELDAFNSSFAYTEATLAKFFESEQMQSRLRGQRRWELNLDAKEVSDIVLARMCQEWFGLPAEANPIIVPGSWRWDWKEGDPPIYPAQFTAPSRYIFQPWPNENVEDYACRMGRALTAALARFIAPHREAGTVPRNPRGEEALLTAAVLAAFPKRTDDELVARTLSGVLMGFLPTVDGNFRLSLNEWLRDGTFWFLRAAWMAVPPGTYPNQLAKARAILWDALVQSMQLRPAPELVWRRATKGGFRIGPEEVREGDVVVLSLVSAAQQCLADGKDDLSMVFGGRRTSTTSNGGHPTHACPGYQAGMGVLLGLLAGLLNSKEFARPSPAPLSFTFEGPMAQA